MTGRKGAMLFITGVLLTAPPASAASCPGNYVAPGHRGHGDISYAEGASIGWTVVDYVDEAGCEVVVCRQGAAPAHGIEDLDFFEFNGVMHKLISGDVVVEKDGFHVTPKRAVRMKVFSTASAFPVEKTPLLYKMNHWREDRLNRRKTLPPLKYLQYLKAHNETCAGLPIQE